MAIAVESQPRSQQECPFGNGRLALSKREAARALGVSVDRERLHGAGASQLSARPRRKLAAIDDPLFAPPRAAPEPSPAAKGTAALYVELPLEQWGALAGAAFELRTHKRRIVAALIAEYVDVTTEQGHQRLSRLLETHTQLSA
jgi:hypothetical protein